MSAARMLTNEGRTGEEQHLISPETILAAILAIFPHMSHNNRQCIERQQARIIQQLSEVSQPISDSLPAPPVELTAAVAFLETHLGCDINEGGNWGAPIDPQHRHTAGTHMHAVQALSRGYMRCGSWEGAVLRFHTGFCDPMHQTRSRAVQQRGVLYLRTVNSIVNRIRTFAANSH